jgi:hypothetical protein
LPALFVQRRYPPAGTAGFTVAARTVHLGTLFYLVFSGWVRSRTAWLRLRKIANWLHEVLDQVGDGAA